MNFVTKFTRELYGCDALIKKLERRCLDFAVAISFDKQEFIWK
jgi:hypothetical protein